MDNLDEYINGLVTITQVPLEELMVEINSAVNESTTQIFLTSQKRCIDPYHLDHVLQESVEFYVGDGGLRGWFRFCVNCFDLNVEDYFLTEKEMSFGIWLFFTAKNKLIVTNGNSLVSPKNRYLCRTCKQVVATYSLKTQIQSGATTVTEQWEIEYIDRSHTYLCKIGDEGETNFRYGHLEGLVETIKNKDGNENIRLRIKAITTDIMQDIYLGKAFNYGRGISEVDDTGNINLLVTDEISLKNMIAKRDKLFPKIRYSVKIWDSL